MPEAELFTSPAQSGLQAYAALQASKSRPSQVNKEAALKSPVIALQRFDDAMRELEDRKRLSDKGIVPKGVNEQDWKQLRRMEATAHKLHSLFPPRPRAAGSALAPLDWLIWKEGEQDWKLALRFDQPRTFLAHLLITQDVSQACSLASERKLQAPEQRDGFYLVPSPEFDGTPESVQVAGALRAPMSAHARFAQGGRTLAGIGGDVRVKVDRSPLYYALTESLLSACYGKLLGHVAPHARLYLMPALQGMPTELQNHPLVRSAQHFLAQMYFALEENYPLTLELEHAQQMMGGSMQGLLQFAQETSAALGQRWAQVRARHNLKQAKAVEEGSKPAGAESGPGAEQTREEFEQEVQRLQASLKLLEGGSFSRILTITSQKEGNPS